MTVNREYSKEKRHSEKRVPAADGRRSMEGVSTETEAVKADGKAVQEPEVDRKLGRIIAAVSVLLAAAIIVVCVVIPAYRIRTTAKGNGEGMETPAEEAENASETDPVTPVVFFGKPRGYETAMEQHGGAAERKELIATNGPDIAAGEEKPARPENVVGTPLNYFYRPSNYEAVEGEVAVKPAYVRYEDGRIVMDCYVICGLTDVQAVYNIGVYNLCLKGRNHVIAEGSFGVLEDLLMGAGDVVTWTFTFEPSEIRDTEADLTDILYLEYRTAYDYHK